MFTTTIAPGTEDHPRNDSASAVELRNGDLLIVWMEFLRSRLKACDEAPNHLASMRSSDGGRTWDRYRVEVERLPHAVNVYDPSLLRLRNGEILFSCFHYTQLEWTKPFRSVGFLRRSRDEGDTFSDPVVFWSEEAIHSANNTLVQLTNGRIVYPIGTTDIWGGPQDNHRCGCMYSDDNGVTWHRSTNWIHLPLRGCAEGHIAETRDGHLLMAMRTQIGSVFLSESTDGGETWSQAQTSGLRSPESMPVLARIPTTGDLLMIWNHGPYLYHPKYDHFGPRTPLTAAISQDSGRTWGKFKNIESDPNGEFSNPAVTFFGGDKALITYYVSSMKNDRLSRDCLSLKATVTSIDWLYAE